MYDGIILGTGHNALVLQAYLARAGLATISLDRRSVAGGGLTTIEHPGGSGFLHNTHSFYHRGLRQMPWYRDLELEYHGASYIEPPLNVALVTSEGRTIRWCSDFAETERSISAFSSADGAKLRYWRDRFRPILESILIPEAQSPPLRRAERERILSGSSIGRELLEVSQLSPLDFVRQEFEHPTVQAGMLFFNGLREVDLRCPGFGHHIPALLASDSLAQMCLGGSKQLADSLVSCIRQHGGEVRTGVELRRILIETDRAVGVELADGTELHARHFVASSLNPQQTFLELIDETELDTKWREAAAGFRYNLLALFFGLYVNLSEPPRYELKRGESSIDDCLMVILGLDHVDQFMEITECHERGEIPKTVMWGSCPSRFDASQAPAGKHTAFMWEKLPFHLHGDARQWPQAAEQHGQALLETWSRYAPNMAEAVLDRFTQTPLQTTQALPNMCEGDLLVGAFTAGQIGFDRPFPGAGHYRTPVAGLYLCGSSSHPGGNITGLPGYNGAQAVLHDLDRPADWMPPLITERLSRLP